MAEDKFLTYSKPMNFIFMAGAEAKLLTDRGSLEFSY